MSIAGVRLTGGRMVWVEAGEFVLEPLDEVTVEIDGNEYQGRVLVAPEALIRPTETEGRIVAAVAHEIGDVGCSELPGADMPPLGTQIEGGSVIAVDAVTRTVTVKAPDGTRNIKTLERNS